MGIKKLPKTWLIYAVPMAVAGLIRIIFYPLWLASPFRHYHILFGLDMRKFILWGESFYNGNQTFTVYKFFVGCLYGIAGKEHIVEAVVITQMVLGVLITGMTVYVFRHIFRNRWGAIVSGLLSALYAPFLIYETQVLKETLFLFLCFSALTAVITLRRKHFSPVYSYITGIFIIAPFYIRFSGLLLGILLISWMIMYCLKKKRSLKPIILTIAGIASLMLIVVGINLKNNKSNSTYFEPNTTYLLEVGANADIQSLSIKETSDSGFISKEKNVSEYLLHYLSKLGYIFSGYEKPNNVNYYFVKQKIPFLKYLIGPLIFIPLSLSGMMLLILNFSKKSKTTVLLLYLFAFIVPMILFVPLARYKIVMAPVFAVFSSYWIYYILKVLKLENRNLLVRPLFIFFIALVFSGFFCQKLPERASDIQAYGVTASYIPDQLMMRGKFHQAKIILEGYYLKNRNNPYIMLNYVSSLLGTGEARKAYVILTRQNKRIKEPALAGRYFYELAECSYLLNLKSQALNFYNLAIQFPISEQRLEMAKSRIISLKKEVKKP